MSAAEIAECRKCGESFARRPSQIRKSDWTCSTCRNARDRVWRAKAIASEKRPASLASDYRAKYEATPEMRAKRTAHASARYHSDPAYREKVRVRSKTRSAIRLGQISKGTCEVCGSKNVEAHHDDYAQPLNVRWLCRIHHREHHRRFDAKAAA